MSPVDVVGPAAYPGESGGPGLTYLALRWRAWLAAAWRGRGRSRQEHASEEPALQAALLGLRAGAALPTRPACGRGHQAGLRPGLLGATPGSLGPTPACGCGG